MNNFKINISRDEIVSRQIDKNNFLISIREGAPINRCNSKLLRFCNNAQFSDEVLDFLDVVTAVFYADKVCIRAERENWVRNITITISLRNPAAFKMVESDLIFALQVLGADNISFRINRLENLVHPTVKAKVSITSEIFSDVNLVSGGQDSMIGAISAIKEGKNPLILKIDTSDKVSLLKILERIQEFSQSEAPPIGFLQSTAKFGRDWQLERSQRLRSIFFLGAGAVLCKQNNINRLNINENGIMAVHIPLDLSRSSTFSTRTAYPLFLSTFEEVCRRWLRIPEFKICNDHLTKTKSEVISDYRAVGAERLLKETFACAHSATVQNTDKKNTKDRIFDGSAKDLHCGYCFPCLLRRISMYAANLSDFDVLYLSNPFRFLDKYEGSQHDSAREGRSAVLSLVGFVREVENLNDDQLIDKFIQISECAAVSSFTTNNFIQLHRRFVREARLYMTHQEPRYLYLINKSQSADVANAFVKLSTNAVLNDALSELPVSWNTPFENQLNRALSNSRFRTQTALANGYLDEDKVIRLIRKSLEQKTKDANQVVELKNPDGIRTREFLNNACSTNMCFPFKKRKGS